MLDNSPDITCAYRRLRDFAADLVLSPVPGDRCAVRNMTCMHERNFEWICEDAVRAGVAWNDMVSSRRKFRGELDFACSTLKLGPGSGKRELSCMGGKGGARDQFGEVSNVR